MYNLIMENKELSLTFAIICVGSVLRHITISKHGDIFWQYVTIIGMAFVFAFFPAGIIGMIVGENELNIYVWIIFFAIILKFLIKEIGIERN